MSFRQLPGASWPHLPQNPVPGKSARPAKAPGLRGGGLADTCLSAPWLRSPPRWPRSAPHVGGAGGAHEARQPTPDPRAPAAPAPHAAGDTPVAPGPRARGGREAAVLVRKERGVSLPAEGRRSCLRGAVRCGPGPGPALLPSSSRRPHRHSCPGRPRSQAGSATHNNREHPRRKRTLPAPHPGLWGNDRIPAFPTAKFLWSPSPTSPPSPPPPRPHTKQPQVSSSVYTLRSPRPTSPKSRGGFR